MGDLGDIYKSGAYLERHETWHAQDSLWKAAQIARILDDTGIELHSVCEAGCGAGEIFRQLSLQYDSANFTGYELSTQVFELCKQREGGRFSTWDGRRRICELATSVLTSSGSPVTCYHSPPAIKPG